MLNEDGSKKEVQRHERAIVKRRGTLQPTTRTPGFTEGISGDDTNSFEGPATVVPEKLDFVTNLPQNLYLDALCGPLYWKNKLLEETLQMRRAKGLVSGSSSAVSSRGNACATLFCEIPLKASGMYLSPMKPAKATGVDPELLFGRTLGLKEGPCPWAELILRRRSSTNKTLILPPQP